MLVQYLRTRFELLRSISGGPVDVCKPFLLLHIWDVSSYAFAIFTGSFRAIRGSFRFLSIFCTFLYRLSDVSSYASAIFTGSFWTIRGSSRIPVDFLYLFVSFK